MTDTLPLVLQTGLAPVFGPALPSVETGFADGELRRDETAFSDVLASHETEYRWQGSSDAQRRQLAERFGVKAYKPDEKITVGGETLILHPAISDVQVHAELVEGLLGCERFGCRHTWRRDQQPPMCWQGKRGEADSLGRRRRLVQCLPKALPSAVNKAVEQAHIRAMRWKACDQLTSISQLERVRKCGVVPIRRGGIVDIRGDENTVSLSGITSCDNSKVCPRCSVPIQADKREQVVGILKSAVAQGRRAAMGTFTLRHHKGQSLAWLLDTLSATFAKVFGKKKIKMMLKAMGMGNGGYLRVIESTHSDANGWHPHIHYLLIFDFPNPEDLDVDELNEVFAEAVAELAGELQAAWIENVTFRRVKGKRVATGLGVPEEQFQDLQVAVTPEAAAEYVMKEDRTAESAAWELASTASKRGRRKGSRTTWQILFDMIAENEHGRPLRSPQQLAYDRALWQEWEEASCLVKDRRMFQTSVGLAKRFGPIESKTAEQAEGARPSTPIVGAVDNWSESMSSPDKYGNLRRDLKKAGVMLSVFRWEVQLTGSIDAGVRALRRWCQENNVHWLEADDPQAEKSRRDHERDNYMPGGSLGYSLNQVRAQQKMAEEVKAWAALPLTERVEIVKQQKLSELNSSGDGWLGRIYRADELERFPPHPADSIHGWILRSGRYAWTQALLADGDDVDLNQLRACLAVEDAISAEEGRLRSIGKHLGVLDSWSIRQRLQTQVWRASRSGVPA